MAQSNDQIVRRPISSGSALPQHNVAVAAGLTALALIVLAATVPLAVLALIVPDTPTLGGDYLAYVASVTGFTVLQATASTILSIAAAIPLARALARQGAFRGRGILLRLLALPLALPALVVVLGIVEVWGRQGWISTMLMTFGLSGPINIYGLTGILIAHVFFNMALSARLLVATLEDIPPENWRLAAQLNFSSRDILRHVEWPVIRSVLPGIASLVFMLCIASFAVVLVLGGGPGATTLEVAIYQSLRFDFDPPRAVLLALLQLGLCMILFALGARTATGLAVMTGTGKRVDRPDQRAARLIDAAVIVIAMSFLAAPMLAILLEGVAAPFASIFSQAAVWRALATSALLAAAAASLALVLAWALLAARRTLMRARRPSRLSQLAVSAMQATGSLILVVPPVVIGAGWFVVLLRSGITDAAAPLVVASVNALMALPFVLRIIGPTMQARAQVHDRLCMHLGLSGWQRWRLIDLPVMARSFGLAFALAAAMSLGDLGAAALFGSADFVTLPLLLLQKMGSYRSLEAGGIALLLALFCFTLLWLAERINASGRMP